MAQFWKHMWILAALVLIAAACGGEDDTTSAPGDAPAVDQPDAPPGDGGQTIDPPAESPSDLAPADIIDATADWSVQHVGTGIKPALALDGEGLPAISFLTEEIAGGIFYTTAAGGWEVQTVAEGYFYGPIDLAFDPAGLPNIVYHDHQDSSFQPDKGDLTLAKSDGSAWNIFASNDPGHDGWDSAIGFGPSGELWATGIEPVEFGTTTGVEFYEFDGGAWTVEPIGGPPITYEFNVSLASSPDGQPVLSYYDDSADLLRVATRTDTGWIDDVVQEGGGMFSSLAVTADGTRHVSFYSTTDATAGRVVYAVDDGSGWVTEDVLALNDIVLGMTGARRITSLQVLDDGTPVIASTDRTGVWLSTRTGEDWQHELVYAAGDRPLGQQVQLVASDGALHLTTFDVATPSPLSGDILYLERRR